MGEVTNLQGYQDSLEDKRFAARYATRAKEELQCLIQQAEKADPADAAEKMVTVYFTIRMARQALAASKG